MNKAVQNWLWVGGILVLAGLTILICVMSLSDWNLSKLTLSEYETNTYGLKEGFTDISVDTRTANVEFIPTDGEARVVCYEQKKLMHKVETVNGKLSISVVDSRKWYDHISIGFTAPKISVYIPSGEYGALTVKSTTGDVKIPQEYKFGRIDIEASTGGVSCLASRAEDVSIKTSTGYVCLDELSALSIEISVTTGDVNLSEIHCQGDVAVTLTTGKCRIKNVECKSFVSKGNTGDISLRGVFAEEKISIERSTGDVELYGSDGGEISLKTDTGDIEGTLLSGKIFVVKSDTGRVNVPVSTSGGRCEATTDTGDIKLELER